VAGNVAAKKMFAEDAGGATPAATSGVTSVVNPREQVQTRAMAELEVAAWRPEAPNGAAARDTELKRDSAATNGAVKRASAFAAANGDIADVAADDDPASDGAFEEKKDDALKGVATNAAANSRAIGATASEMAEGISAEQVAEIKAAIQAEKKFLGELVDQSSRWQVEGMELRIFFPVEKRAFAELLEGREALEKIRAQASRVLGKPVRVCAKIESIAAAAAAGAASSSPSPGSGAVVSGTTPRNSSGNAELRARFESDPMVRSMLDRFGGKISEVKPPDS
jgi:hypothetical protein